MILTENNMKIALETALKNSVYQKEGKEDKVRKFDETLDIIINFRDLDIKNPNNKIAQEFLLPNKIHSELNICFISKGDQLVEVKEKGYDVCDDAFLGDLDKKDKKTKKEFVKKYDSFICRADLMRNVAKTLGRFLGQSGKMPKPQPKGYGIVKPNEKVDKIIDNFSKRISLQIKKAPLIQTVFGKKSLKLEENLENLKALLSFIEHQLPNGQGNIKSIYIKTTMGKPSKVAEPVSKKSSGGRK